MLKTIFVSVFLFFASILLVANTAWSSPLLHDTFIVAQTSVPRVPSEVKPSSELETSQESKSSQSPKDSKTEAFRDQNQKTSTSSRSEKTQAESGSPYDMESIKAFNRALYGS